MRHVLVIALLLSAFAAHAADKGAKWSNTLFLPLSIRHVDDFGIGGGLGWQEPRSHFIIIGQMTYDRIDGVAGAVAVPHRPCLPKVPFTVGSRSQLGFEFTMGIPLGRAAAGTGHH
jgi:hypothetical protein